MKEKFIRAYMDVARRFAELSSARRLQVGAIVVKDDRIISIGYNGMPTGWDNNCEDKVWDMGSGGWLSPEEFAEEYPYEEQIETVDIDGNIHKIVSRFKLKTKPEVLHAESNAIAKLAKSNDSGDGADLFVTHSPCIECAKLIYQSGIGRVFYSENYRNDQGIKFLKKSGVDVRKIEDDNVK